MSRRIGFLGFGEAARAFCDSLRETDPALAFSAYDVKVDGTGADVMRAAMAGRGVACCANAAALANADFIFSAVTADKSLEAVEPLRSVLGPGCALFDINSVSPKRKRATAAIVGPSGARYVDMAVMSPVSARRHRTPVLVAGADQCDVDFLKALEFDFETVGDNPGDATAIKMVRSLFVKGLEALTVQTMLAAEAAGCGETILKSLASSYPGLGWPQIARYHFERMLTHGARRAAEMRECAAMLDDLGLEGSLAISIARVHSAMGVAGGAVKPAALEEMLAGALRALWVSAAQAK